MQSKNYQTFKKGIGVIVKISGDIDKNGKQKYRPGIIIKSYPSHAELQLLTTVKNEKYAYHELTINNQKQYIKPIYYRTLPWNQIISKWIIDGKEISLSLNNPLFVKIAENKIRMLNDNYQLVHKRFLQKEKKKIKLLNKELEINDQEFELEYE